MAVSSLLWPLEPAQPALRHLRPAGLHGFQLATTFTTLASYLREKSKGFLDGNSCTKSHSHSSVAPCPGSQQKATPLPEHRSRPHCPVPDFAYRRPVSFPMGYRACWHVSWLKTTTHTNDLLLRLPLLVLQIDPISLLPLTTSCCCFFFPLSPLTVSSSLSKPLVSFRLLKVNDDLFWLRPELYPAGITGQPYMKGWDWRLPHSVDKKEPKQTNSLGVRVNTLEPALWYNW